MKEDLLRLAAYTSFILFLSFVVTNGGNKSLLEVANSSQTAATFFVTSITAAEIQESYAAVTTHKNTKERVRVLIVPGHGPDSGGAEFGSTKERDLVVEIAHELADLIAAHPNYEVTVTRGKEAWNPDLQTFFDTKESQILAFKDFQTKQMSWYVSHGSILPAVDQVYHNTASTKASTQLYGINMWANERDIDIALHLHLNDYAGRRGMSVGKYDGFAIYVPDRQYSNAEASKAIGTAIANRLNAFHATSTLAQERAGVIEDQELIAIGANNTTDAAALLIEYGYIYEPQFTNASTRSVAIKDYAYATYLGLQDFFDDAPPSTGSFVVPYDWSEVSVSDGAKGSDVYAVQSALRLLGYYPPSGESFSSCPISGVVGDCTRRALKEYQRSKGLDAVGTVGPRTREALENDLNTP